MKRVDRKDGGDGGNGRWGWRKDRSARRVRIGGENIHQSRDTMAARGPGAKSRGPARKILPL